MMNFLLRIRILALVLAMLLGSMVSAQNYNIRVAFNTKLRSAASLEANIVESAPAGTILNVLGEAGRWLQISRNGATVWMASWVRHQRVDTSQQTQAPQQQTTIDNCCFVDRQCNTDQDWTDGYYAFQNGQCAAPAQTQTQTTTQPVTTIAPAVIDNCCFVDRQCSTDQDWTAGYYAFRDGQCAAPAQTQTQTATQPVTSTAPAVVDNCCFVDRLCQNDQDWTAGYYAFLNNQCGAAAQSAASSWPESTVLQRTANAIVIGYPSDRRFLPSISITRSAPLGESISFNNCCDLNWQCHSDQDRAEGYRAFRNKQCALPGVISIVGEPAFIEFYAQRLDELKNKLPHRYDYVLNGMDKIEQAPDDLLAGSIFGRAFTVPWTGPLVNGWDKRRSAVIVHEACHIHREDAGFFAYACDLESRIREETICREMELAVIIELDAPSHIIEWAQGMVADTRAGIGFWMPDWC